MRNMAVLHSPAFSYPLPVLVRVLSNLLIFKGKILYYNKYTKIPIKHLLFIEKNTRFSNKKKQKNSLLSYAFSHFFCIFVWLLKKQVQVLLIPELPLLSAGNLQTKPT